MTANGQNNELKHDTTLLGACVKSIIMLNLLCNIYKYNSTDCHTNMSPQCYILRLNDQEQE